ncbi:MAG: hypothetical protein ACE5Q3_05265, partial [Alphaproteobacteria bacterium]
DIVRIARSCGVSVADAGRIYFGLGARLGIDWLRHATKRVKPESEWEKLAVAVVVDDSFGHQSELTTRVLDAAGDGKLGARAVGDIIDTWLDGRRQIVERTGALFAELRGAPEIDLAMLTVANRQLRALVAGKG